LNVAKAVLALRIRASNILKTQGHEQWTLSRKLFQRLSNIAAL